MVTTFQSLEALDEMVRPAVIDLLYRLADDELFAGLRAGSASQLQAPGNQDNRFAAIARDELSHAHAYYALLHELGEPSPDVIVTARQRRQFRCASFASLQPDDWTSAVLCQFLHDTVESVRLAVLSKSTLEPLAQLARGLQAEEKDHLAWGRTCVLQLNKHVERTGRAPQDVLAEVYPHALGVFEPTEADEVLAQAEICPKEERLCPEWESAVAPVLNDAGLEAWPSWRPVYGGRVGRHPAALDELLAGFRGFAPADPLRTG